MASVLRLLPAAAIALTAACEAGPLVARPAQPTSVPTTAVSRATPAAAPDPSHGCPLEVVRALIDAYVAAYNARDFPALRALFDVEHRFFEYSDSVQGAAAHFNGSQAATQWERYVRERFAAGERLVVSGVQHYDGYADVRLTRPQGQSPVALGGSAKIVCDGGRIIRVVMSS